MLINESLPELQLIALQNMRICRSASIAANRVTGWHSGFFALLMVQEM